MQTILITNKDYDYQAQLTEVDERQSPVVRQFLMVLGVGSLAIALSGKLGFSCARYVFW